MKEALMIIGGIVVGVVVLFVVIFAASNKLVCKS